MHVKPISFKEKIPPAATERPVVSKVTEINLQRIPETTFVVSS